MSEVSQLNEMHAVLIASKEDNHKKRQEEKELSDKIKTFEVYSCVFKDHPSA